MVRLKIAATIASFFSILFASSIILELKGFISGISLWMTAIFVLFMLIVNEFLKIHQLRKKFDKVNHSFTIIAFTFLLSFSLSGIGIFLWINKSHHLEIERRTAHSNEKLKIEKDYQIKIDLLDQSTKENSELQTATESLKFWKKRNCHNDEERMMARTNIMRLETEISSINAKIKEEKNTKLNRLLSLKKAELDVLETNNVNQTESNGRNKFLFSIILSLVILAELMIMYLQYIISNYYTPEQKRNLKILKSVLDNGEESISFNYIRYNGLLDNTLDISQRKSYAKNFYYLLGDLGIIYHGGKIVDNKKSYKILADHYLAMNDSA